MGVIAGRDQDQAGLERACDRGDDVLDQRHELPAAGPRGHRKVDGEPLAFALAGVLGRAGARIPRPLVDAGVENVAGGGEDRLRAVAVVDVPIEDQDALGSAGIDRVPRRDRGVVEEAEAHCPVALGVMAGRTQAAERRGRLGREQELGSRGGTAGCSRSGLERIGCRHRVHVDHAPATRAEGFDRVDVSRVVNASELLARRRRRLEALEPEPASVVERGLDRDEAAGVLGMRARFVKVGRRV